MVIFSTFFLLMFFTEIVICAKPASNKPEDANHIYGFSNQRYTWDKARRKCATDFIPNKKGTLLSIDTPAELAIIKEKLQAKSGIGNIYWIGGKYNATLNWWLWIDGTRVGNFIPWKDGVPAIGAIESRLALLKNRNQITLISQPKGRSFDSICEVSGE